MRILNFSNTGTVHIENYDRILHVIGTSEVFWWALFETNRISTSPKMSPNPLKNGIHTKNRTLLISCLSTYLPT
jgi:hypothetical protein